MTEFVGALHIGIVAAYFSLAFVFGVLFKVPKRQGWARLGAASFFVGCGLTHVGLTSHAFSGEPIDSVEWHHVLPVVMQVIGAPLFIWSFWPHVRTVLEPARYEAVESTMASVIVDMRDRTIHDLNERATELLGYTRRELVGESLDVLIPKALRDSHHLFEQGYMKHPTARSMAGRDLPIVDKQGNHRIVLIGLAPVSQDHVAAAIIEVGGVGDRRGARPHG